MGRVPRATLLRLTVALLLLTIATTTIAALLLPSTLLLLALLLLLTLAIRIRIEQRIGTIGEVERHGLQSTRLRMRGVRHERP